MTSQADTPGVGLLRAAVFFVCAVAAAGPASALETLLNYDDLSFLDAPLATEVGDVSLVLKGQLDGAWTWCSRDDDETGESFNGGFQAGAQTQLPNRWRLRLNYSGRYATDPGENPDSGFVSRADGGYEADAALSVGGAWGTVAGGNVSGIVRERTRRTPGAGAAALAFDDVFGSLGDWSGAYMVRFGPWVLAAVVDEDVNFDAGAAYQRPTGDKDYRLTVRYTEGRFTSADGSKRFDTRALSGVGELIYGSALFDVGAGYETLSSPGLELEQWYVSTGVRFKAGVMTFSVEGHYGQAGGVERTSAALGVQYDLARGLSANFGLNHEDAMVSLGGVGLIASRGTTTVLSLRYSF